MNGPEHEIQSYNSVAYGYINDERLESAMTGSTTYSMVYDALGRCMKRSISNGATTYYIYDGEKRILEYDSGWTSVGINLFGKEVDELLERIAIGSDSNWWAYFPQQNHEGSVTLLTDSTGSAIERYRYDAFGAPTIYDANWNSRSNTIYDNRFLFTGREYAATYRSTYNTPAFNFYEYRARAYNPQLGRFMSEDPKLFDAGDYNLFRYCHDDPIDNVDPMGMGWLNAGTPTPELLNYLYGTAMAKAQWIGSDLMHAQNASGAIGIGAGGYQYDGFLSAWSAAKAGATYGYKSIQADRAQGKEGNDLREYYGTAKRNKDKTFHITSPDKGDPPRYVPPSGSRKDGELGYSSTIPCGPDCAGIYYAHPRPGDLIHNHPADMQEAAGAHHGAGVLAVTAAPQRGDSSGRGRPVFEGYDGTTNKLQGNSFFNQFPDFY